MTVVFFDKKAETYVVVDNAVHMHVGHYLNGARRKIFVLYTEDGIKYFPCNEYDLHKIDI